MSSVHSEDEDESEDGNISEAESFASIDDLEGLIPCLVLQSTLLTFTLI